jgi:hypothetical protein
MRKRLPARHPNRFSLLGLICGRFLPFVAMTETEFLRRAALSGLALQA